MSTFGVVYVAFGAPYLAMAITSLVSLRATNPTLPVCIITNVVRDMPDKPWWRSEDGDTWIYLSDGTERNRHAKTSVYRLSPFDLTLFLDCDTMVLGDLSPIPRYLKYFDFLVKSDYEPSVKEKRRILNGEFLYLEDGHFNGGVFAFRRNKKVENFFALWNERFHALGYRVDQPSLVEAYFLSDVRMFPLPHKFNSGDKWADPTSTRDKIIVWHYKVRLEPLVEQLVVKAVRWFGGNDNHLAETEQFLRERRARRHSRSPRWWFRRLVTKLRGDQSRRLETHPSKHQWTRWTQH